MIIEQECVVAIPSTAAVLKSFALARDSNLRIPVSTESHHKTPAVTIRPTGKYFPLFRQHSVVSDRHF